MPNPKRRHSRRRTRTRRAHDFLVSKSLSTCPHCQEQKMPHRVCLKCGYYKGREVVAVKDVL
ncbi:MAG TPA: 50S ribosomal protein L32 [Thermoanaerobaculia bacterium]|nr:50S ribosomal protein L32 [Thermoanaerobaculia bacterium]